MKRTATVRKERSKIFERKTGLFKTGRRQRKGYEVIAVFWAKFNPTN
jgi:hypothetical protein